MAYEQGWRSDKQSGEIAWTNDWVTGQNFQQLKGKGPVNSAFDKEFAGLTKGDSDVDDSGAWVTLKQQSGDGATEDAKALAEKWAAAGYDVRVQDLEGAEGTTQADIAVRKGSGTSDVEEVQKVMSPKLAEAKARAAQYEEDQMSGRYSEEIYGGKAPDTTSFLERYKLKLGEPLENGMYEYKDYSPEVKKPDDFSEDQA